MTSIRILPETEDDLKKAAIWYESQSTGLGYDLIEEYEAALVKIQETPLLWPIYEGGRRYLLHRFPYSIIYIVEEEEIIIFAVTHHKRKPGYWRDRI